jgi:hypothetical protein
LQVHLLHDWSQDFVIRYTSSAQRRQHASSSAELRSSCGGHDRRQFFLLIHVRATISKDPVVLFDALSFPLTIVNTGAASTMTSRATICQSITVWSLSAGEQSTESTTGSSATRGAHGARRVTLTSSAESTSAISSDIPL